MRNVLLKALMVFLFASPSLAEDGSSYPHIVKQTVQIAGSDITFEFRQFSEYGNNFFTVTNGVYTATGETFMEAMSDLRVAHFAHGVEDSPLLRALIHPGRVDNVVTDIVTTGEGTSAVHTLKLSDFEDIDFVVHAALVSIINGEFNKGGSVQFIVMPTGKKNILLVTSIEAEPQAH